MVNDSAVQKNFSIFNAFPKQSTSVGEPWQKVWAVSPLVNNTGGSTSFGIKEEFYAVCGMSPQTIAEGVTISTQDQIQVYLASTSTPGTRINMLAKEGGVCFDKNNLGQETIAGTYEIDTAKWAAVNYG